MTKKSKISLQPPLCLEFANHFSGRNQFKYKDLIQWSQQKGSINRQRAEELIGITQSYPQKGDPIVGEARILAICLYQIFSHLSENTPPKQEDIDFLNGSISKVFNNLKLEPSSSLNFHWGWNDQNPPCPEEPLWRVVLSAGNILVEAQKERVRLCQGQECQKLFLDTSKGGRRKWCSMDTCGNQSKTRRYREKAK